MGSCVCLFFSLRKKKDCQTHTTSMAIASLLQFACSNHLHPCSSLIETHYVSDPVSKVFSFRADVLYRWVFVEADKADVAPSASFSAPKIAFVIDDCRRGGEDIDMVPVGKGVWVGSGRPVAIFGYKLQVHVPRPGHLVMHSLLYDFDTRYRLFVVPSHDVPSHDVPSHYVCKETDVEESELALSLDSLATLSNALCVGQNCSCERPLEIIDCLVWSPEETACNGALFVVNGYVHTVVTPALTSAIVAGVIGSMRYGYCVLPIGVFRLTRLEHWAFYRNFYEAVLDMAAIKKKA